MKLTTLSVFSGLLLGAASAVPALEARLPRYGAFGAWLARDCPASGPDATVEFTYGNDCGVCNNFYGDKRMQSVNVYGLDPRCFITFHISHDCSDPGIQSGIGSCWDPEGGVAGWTITCPGEQPNDSDPFAICRQTDDIPGPMC